MALKKIAGKSVREAPRTVRKKARMRAKPHELRPDERRMAKSLAFG